MSLVQTIQTDVVSDSQYVTFSLVSEEYALPILKVREIVPLRSIRSIPGTPRYVRGVMDVRGLIIPVIDLRARLGLDASDGTRAEVVIIVKLAWDMVGFVVDGVSDILTIAREDIEPVTGAAGLGDQRFIRGLARTGERLIPLLDPEAVAGAAD